MTAKHKSPWRMFLPLASVVLIFILWSGYWSMADGVARREADAARTRLAARGLTLACDGEFWGGYPFRFEYNCGRPVLRLRDTGKISSNALLAVAQAYNPFHVISLIDGPTIAVMPGDRTVVFNHDRAIVSTVLKGGDLPQISAEIANVTALGLFAAGDMQLHTRAAADNGNDIALTAQRLQVQIPGKLPLVIDSARLVGTLTPDRTYDIREFAFVSGAVKLTGQGQLALDSEHRPSGIIHAETNDPQGVLELFDPFLHMGGKERALLQSALMLLGNSAKADIIARNGELFIGPMKVGNLLPLDYAL